jgi:hypothetical protein
MLKWVGKFQTALLTKRIYMCILNEKFKKKMKRKRNGNLRRHFLLEE